jgi:hypothetical protein
MGGKKSESRIVAHARRELNLAGAFDRNENYDGGVGRGILTLVKAFDEWSKGSKAKAESIALGFNQVIAGGLLSPPTTAPDEWETVEGADKGTMRNKRSPMYVSTDFGKTWMNLQTKETGWSKNHITGKEPTDEDKTTTADEASAGGDQGSSEAEAQPTGPGLDAGVETKGAEDPSQPQDGTKKPETGEA